MGFGARLKEILAQKGKSIIWLSEQTGIPRNSLYTITKRDNTTPRLETIKKMHKLIKTQTFSMTKRQQMSFYHT